MVLDLYAASKVSPIAGWPESYAPWIVEGVIELHREIERVSSEAVRSASSGKK